MRVMTVNDFESPVNGGLWTIAWPTLEFYQQGLELMHRTTWNVSHGFDSVGSPEHIHKTYPRVRARLESTRMLRTNSWFFSMGDCDQAFLFYALYLRSHVGQDFEPVNGLIGSMQHGKNLPTYVHTARHWYSAPKPWVWTKCQAQMAKGKLAGSCALLPRSKRDWLPTGGRTFWYLVHTNFTAKINASACAAKFAQVLPWLWNSPRIQARIRKVNVSMVLARPPKYSGALQRVR